VQDNELLILTAADIRTLLDGQEQKILQQVGKAYKAHVEGKSTLPHSSFLRFPDHDLNRIIALPAYLGEPFKISGIKWVASYPDNIQQGIDRASATLTLNSVKTGRPCAFMDASIINGKRTAASAALAAKHIHAGQTLTAVGILGCGFINYETVRFLLAVFPKLHQLVLYDINPQAADYFKIKALQELTQLESIQIADNLDAMLSSTQVIALGTTVGKPYLTDISALAAGSTVLNISLRDLGPEVILQADNIVDDLDHVCRANTSIHLTAEQVGHRDFVRCSIGEVLLDQQAARLHSDDIVIFSPFGLGVLDIAVGKLAQQLSSEQGLGMVVKDFLPEPWRAESFS
jgi:2,3-diaminopropionate biosynthesis protein SbnB